MVRSSPRPGEIPPSVMGGNMSEQQNPGDRIRDARMARGWSQARLAREAGVVENTVLSIEKGRRVTQGDKLRAVLDALGMASLEDDSTLDMSGVPDDVRTFLRVAARRFAAMEEDVRVRLLNDLYPRLIEEQEPAARAIARKGIERRSADERGEQADTPEVKKSGETA